MAKINTKTFKEALKNSGGIQARMAAKLEVSRQAVGNFLKRHPEMRVFIDDEAENVLDIIEDNITASATIHKDVDDGKWILIHSKRGKARGWGQKQEIEHSGEEKNYTFNLVVKSMEEIKREKLDNQPKTA